MKFVGEQLADVKRRDFANVDGQILRLKRQVLAERLEDFKSALDTAAKQAKANIENDLIRRNLANSTIRDSYFRTVDRDAASELERGTREFNRALEEIALIESKVEIQNRPPWWKKLFR